MSLFWQLLKEWFDPDPPLVFSDNATEYDVFLDGVPGHQKFFTIYELATRQCIFSRVKLINIEDILNLKYKYICKYHMEFHTICVINRKLEFTLSWGPPTDRPADRWEALFCLFWPQCHTKGERSARSSASVRKNVSLKIRSVYFFLSTFLSWLTFDQT